MKSLDQSAIRKQNVRRILDLLTAQSPRTRQSLAEATGLSLMSVTNLVDQLKEQQVLELAPVPRDSGNKPSSGRKAENISLRGGGHAWLVVDLSGNHFRYVLLGFDLTLLAEKNCTAEGAYLSRLTAFLSTIRDEITAPLDGRTLLGVAVVAQMKDVKSYTCVLYSYMKIFCRANLLAAQNVILTTIVCDSKNLTFTIYNANAPALTIVGVKDNSSIGIIAQIREFCFVA